MTLWQLVFKEIYRRKLNFLTGLSSVIIAIAALISAATSLSIHDIQTQEIIDAKKIETENRMKNLEDDFRVIMKKLGFNLLILPEDQNLADLFIVYCVVGDIPQHFNVLGRKTRRIPALFKNQVLILYGRKQCLLLPAISLW